MEESSKKAAERAVFGNCNICNEYGELTRDHVPPKGSIHPKPVEIRSFLKWIMTEKAPGRVNLHGEVGVYDSVSRSRFSQNGVKFRSICAICNNVRLGGRYDPELNRVSKAMGDLIRMHQSIPLLVPREFSITIRTHYLVRAIVGHLLAARRPRDLNSQLRGSDHTLNAGLRNYFLDETRPLPADIKIYCWPYLAQDQVIISGLGISSMNGKRGILGDLIKFFPMAYYVTHTLESPLDLAVASIRGDGCNDMDCEVSLHVPLDSVPPPDWPETPGSEHYTIMPADSSVVTRALPRRWGRSHQSKRGPRK
jgi:hypothetical protein